MKKTAALLTFTIAIMVLSCEKELDVKIIPTTPLLVLNSPFAADSTWLVSLTKTGDILDYRSKIIPVDDAEIIILDEKNMPLETLQHVSPPTSSPSSFGLPTQITNSNYRGKTAPSAGKVYSVQVKAAGASDIFATSKIPLPVPISSVTIDTFRYNLPREVGMDLTFHDPVQEKNFYQIRIYRVGLVTPMIVKNGMLVPDDTKKPYYANGYLSFISDGLVDELDGSSVIPDDIFNGKDYKIRLRVKNFDYTKKDQPVHIVLVSVTKEYYDYFTSLKLVKNADDNVLAQPAQVYTNVRSGLGIFAGYSVSEFVLK